MSDDVTDVNTEITLDDFMADEQEPVKADPSPVETKPEVAPAEEAEVDEPVTEPPAKETEDPKVEETDPPQTKADERKNQLNTEIRDLVAQRNALKADITKVNAEVYQPATADELVEQGLSATDAKVEALRQEIELRDYNEKVAEAQLTLSSESHRVLLDFPIFNQDSDQYDKDLAESAAETLDANLIRDPNTNQIIGTNPGFSTYKFYQILDRAAGISAAKGQIKGQQATEQMLANADTNSSAAPAKKPVDPLVALWQED